MRQLPEGTVTFLFTDIEGSTRLLQKLGDSYAAALAEHRRALREVFGRHGGVEVDTQGDAFFVAFPRAADALAAAREGQEALARGPVRVRMGIHTGEPSVTAEGYVGIDVHRAARIAAAGHGGQVLVSQTTYDLTGGDGLRDLGAHRLKDLSEPERLFQVGEGEFPALKTLYETNLPVPATPFLGRGQELEEIVVLFREHRLVTLTGTGGSGKTRLALQAAGELADAFPDGVWFVPLAALRDPDVVEPTIARTLGATEQTLAEHLRNRELALVLDNFEQLLPAAVLLPRLLEQAPRCRFLTTSRVRLRVSGEREYPVQPLVDQEAVELFIERAQAVDPGFAPDESIRAICVRLDKLPLALELAAARTTVFTPAAILARLDERLPLLTGGAQDAPERQRTLRATTEWSYDLLDTDERELFPKLAVFAGGFELEAAEAVCGAGVDALQGLVEKNLLRRQRDGRFFMLATIREFAAELLRDDRENESVRRRHAMWILALVGEAELYGPGQRMWFGRLEAELDNIRAALRTLRETDVPAAVELAGTPVRFWRRGRAREAFEALRENLAEAGDASLEVRLDAVGRAAFLAYLSGDSASAVPLAEEGLALALSTDDPRLIGKAKDRLGSVLGATTEYQRAQSLHEEAIELHRQLGDPHELANSLHNLSDHELMVGMPEAALAHASESLDLYRRTDDALSAAATLLVVAEAKVRLGDGAVAEEIREALELHRTLADAEGIVKCLQVAAVATAAEGRDVAAARALGAAEGFPERSEEFVQLEFREQAVRDRLVQELRTRLGDARFEKLAAEGRALDVDEAIADALG